MNVIYIALPIALLLGGSALLACIYCIRSGQFDDLETPPLRMLTRDPDGGSLPNTDSEPTGSAARGRG